MKQRESDFGTAIEQSAVGESDANATIEKAIQDVEGQIRTMRAALEMRVLEKIKLKDPIVPWLVRHAGCLISRCRIRPNGRTPLEMFRGRKTNAPIAEQPD